MPALPWGLSAFLTLALALVQPVFANGSLFQRDDTARVALITLPAQDAPKPRGGGSLYATHDTGFFAPRAPRISPVPQVGSSAQVARLRQLIESAESRRDGYDAVQHGAKIKPAKPPTQMTLGEIYDWIAATPRQPHAIGRYQFIPKTLRRLARELKLPRDIRFSPDVQDRLADILLREAGLPAMKQGDLPRHAFMKNLAKIWAGFPTSTGRSYYHGFAGNKASMSWAAFDREMKQIFPGPA